MRASLVLAAVSSLVAAGCSSDDANLSTAAAGATSGGTATGGSIATAGVGGVGGTGGVRAQVGGNAGTNAGTAGAMSGMGGATGAAGSGGGAGTAACTPEAPFDATPVTAAAGQWTWVAVPEAKCRGGSSTGFGIRLNPGSDKLIIYLEAGGACFNPGSCSSNASAFGAQDFQNWAGGAGKGGLLSTTNAKNPVRDWNAVYIPYCTGDVHSGNATGVNVPGAGGPQQQAFVGFANLGHDLKRIIPTFPNVTRVLLTGVSAGGFGAAYNYDRVAQAFCPRPVVLLDDSGPSLGDDYVAPCLQSRQRQLWNNAATLPADCLDCTGPDGGGSINSVSFLGQKYPNAQLGLVSSEQDSVIASFIGYGQNDCTALDAASTAPLPGSAYAAGLAELRTQYMQSPAWSSYIIPGSAHTFLAGDGYPDINVGGVALGSWVAALVEGDSPGHVGP